MACRTWYTTGSSQTSLGNPAGAFWVLALDDGLVDLPWHLPVSGLGGLHHLHGLHGFHGLHGALVLGLLGVLLLVLLGVLVLALHGGQVGHG